MSESNVNAPPASAASANGLGYGPIKPLAVRLNESTRTQLDIIAQLNDRTVTDEVRLAIEAWIDKTKADPAIQRRAKDVRDEIEREAAGKRGYFCLSGRLLGIYPVGGTQTATPTGL